MNLSCISLAVPLSQFSLWKVGFCCMDNNCNLNFMSWLYSCKGHSSFVSFSGRHRKQQLQVLSQILFGERMGARGRFCRCFWHGKSVDERREHGVEFAVISTPLQSVEVGSDGNKRITTLRLHTKKGTSTLVSVYAHTLYSDEQVKDTFYEKLNLIVWKLPKCDQLVI